MVGPPPRPVAGGDRDDQRARTAAGLAERERCAPAAMRGEVRRPAARRPGHVAWSRTVSARRARSSATRWATSASRCRIRTVPCEDAVSTATRGQPEELLQHAAGDVDGLDARDRHQRPGAGQPAGERVDRLAGDLPAVHPVAQPRRARRCDARRRAPPATGTSPAQQRDRAAGVGRDEDRRTPPPRRRGSTRADDALGDATARSPSGTATRRARGRGRGRVVIAPILAVPAAVCRRVPRWSA